MSNTRSKQKVNPKQQSDISSFVSKSQEKDSTVETENNILEVESSPVETVLSPSMVDKCRVENPVSNVTGEDTSNDDLRQLIINMQKSLSEEIKNSNVELSQKNIRY